MIMLPVAILAGGLATRIRPVTEKIPKALLPFNGKPFIFHQLSLLKGWGITKAVICAWYLGEMIQQEIGDGSDLGMEIQYSFDGDVPLGTGGAIRKALPFLDDNFFVLYGDSYLLCNFSEVQKSFYEQQKNALMTVFKNNGLWDRSNVEFDNGIIRRYDKTEMTPQMNYIDYGLGIFNKAAFENEPLDQFLDLANIYQIQLKANQLSAYEVHERFYEVGSFQGIEDLKSYLSKENVD